MKRALSCTLVLLLSFSITGCNGLSAATKAQNVITAVITVAKAEAPVVPAQDQAAYSNFVNLAISLDGQLAKCITSVSGIMGKSGKFASCFTTFASGLTTPAELAQLRVLNPQTQQKVQLYLTSIVAGVNVALAFFSNSAVPPPVVTPTPTSAKDVQDFMRPILAQQGL